MNHTLRSHHLLFLCLILVLFTLSSCTSTPKKKPYVSAVENALYNMIPKLGVPYAVKAELRAIENEVGVKEHWKYASFSGSVVTLREIRQLDNTLCREIQHEIVLKLETKKLFGSKCKKHGKWY